MPYYVEMLRAKRALIVAAIILGLILLAAICVRVSLGNHSIRDWPSSMTSSPTAHVTRTVFRDGSVRTVIDDPARNTHAVFVQRAGVMTFDVTAPRRDVVSHNMSYGNLSMNEEETKVSGVRHVHGYYTRGDTRLDIGVLFLVTLPIALVVATILAGPLSKENDGHLELAWTRPFSRDYSALSFFAVDCAAIVLSALMTLAVLLVACLLFEVPAFKATADMPFQILLALAGPIAWYALLTCASASLKRGLGMVIGLGWFVALLIPGLNGLREAADTNAFAAAIYTVAHPLSYLDPITYFSFTYRHGMMNTALGLSLGASVAALVILAVVYLALSVAQWRRVEA